MRRLAPQNRPQAGRAKQNRGDWIIPAENGFQAVQSRRPSRQILSNHPMEIRGFCWREMEALDHPKQPSAYLSLGTQKMSAVVVATRELSSDLSSRSTLFLNHSLLLLGNLPQTNGQHRCSDCQKCKQGDQRHHLAVL